MASKTKKADPPKTKDGHIDLSEAYDAQAKAWPKAADRKLTAVEATTELLAYADQATKRCAEAQGKMLQRLAGNPADAIGWCSDDMVKEQTRHERWEWIRGDLENHAPLDVLAEAILEANRMVRRFFGSNSTSLFHNAVERARAEACERLIDELEDIREYFERHMPAKGGAGAAEDLPGPGERMPDGSHREGNLTM